MGEPVPAALDYFGCDKQSPDGSCVGLITPQVSCVRAPEDCDKRSPDGRGTPWAEDSFISSCFTLCMDVWFMDLLPPPNPKVPTPSCAETRIIMLGFSFFTMLMIGAYTASLASFLVA